MIGRTIVRYSVAIAYFSFFAAVFFAAVFFGSGLLRRGFFAAAFALLALFARPCARLRARVFGAACAPARARRTLATGAATHRSRPTRRARRRDHRMWYVDASANGITCAFGRLRPLRIHVLLHTVGENENLLVGTSMRLEQAEQARGLRRVVIEARRSRRASPRPRAR